MFNVVLFVFRECHLSQGEVLGCAWKEVPCLVILFFNNLRLMVI